MKATWRDYATILMAFAAVFLCGYGIGHLVCEHRLSAPAAAKSSAPAWQDETLQTLNESLDLRPEQRERVEQELARTAQAINESYQDVLLDYHRHVDQLYERLIDILDEEQADQLRAEKNALERQIELLQH